LTISAIIRKLDVLDETANLLTVFCVSGFNVDFIALSNGFPLTDYAFKDAVSRQHMINSDRNDKGPPRTVEEKKRQLEDLGAVTQYCRNEVDCRRSLVLAHFNELFDSRLCSKGCDNCSRGGTIVRQLYTSEAQQAIRLFEEMAASMDRIPVGHFKDVFAGRNKAKVRDSGHDQLSLFGVGKSIDGDRIISVMMGVDIFAIAREASASGWTNDYLKVINSSLVLYVKTDVTLQLEAWSASRCVPQWPVPCRTDLQGQWGRQWIISLSCEDRCGVQGSRKNQRENEGWSRPVVLHATVPRRRRH
jgi:hypothetical protein